MHVAAAQQRAMQLLPKEPTRHRFFVVSGRRLRILTAPVRPLNSARCTQIIPHAKSVGPTVLIEIGPPVSMTGASNGASERTHGAP